MDFRYLLQILRAHWLFITILSLVAGLGGLAATYIIPEKYSASTKILIRPQKEVEASPGSTKQMMDYPVSFNIPVESISQTYAEIMVSEAVATKVVEILHLDVRTPKVDPRWYVQIFREIRNWVKVAVKNTWDFVRFGRIERKTPYWQAVEDVLEALKAEPVKDTYLFTLTASANEPDVAKHIANTAAQVFMEYTRDSRLREGGTSTEFIGKNLETVQGELKKARSGIDRFRKQSNAASLDEELTLKLNAISQFEADIETGRKQLREIEAELAVLRAQEAGQRKEIHSSTTLAKNPVLQQLETELASFEVELAGLNQTLNPAHPKVQSMEAKIAEAKNRIQAETAQVREKDTSVANPLQQELEKRLLDRTALRDSLLARLDSLGTTVQRYQSDIGRLTSHKSELARLTLDMSALEDTYKLVSKEYAESRLAAARDISEIRVIHPATQPLYPVRPIKIYYAGGGLAMGFLIALGLVLFIDYLDRHLRTREDIEGTFGIPVLATLPHARLSAGRAELINGPRISGSLPWSTLDHDSESQEGKRSDSQN
jgi:uncharacterized protein involved in exopolysaccharide biosynthesis